MAWQGGKVAPRPPSRINFLAVVSDRLLSAATCLMMSKEEVMMMIVAQKLTGILKYMFCKPTTLVVLVSSARSS